MSNLIFIPKKAGAAFTKIDLEASSSQYLDSDASPTPYQFGNGNPIGAVSMWCNFETLGSGGSSNSLVCMRENTTDNDTYLLLHSDGNKLRVLMRKNDTQTMSVYADLPLLTTGTTYHIVFCMNNTINGALEAWVDGSTVTWGTNTWGDVDVQEDWYNINWDTVNEAPMGFIGAREINSSLSAFMDGTIDNVAIYAGFRITQTEVDEWYNSGTPGDHTTMNNTGGLIEYYKFDGNATDDSGSGHDLNERNSPSYV